MSVIYEVNAPNVFAVLLAVSSLAVLVAVLAICTCLGKKQTRSSGSGVNLKESETDAESGGGVSGPISADEDQSPETSVHHGKRSSEINNKHMSNGRASQDQRALPDIPPVPLMTDRQQEEFVDENDDLYESISNKNSKTTEKNAARRKSETDHCYESVPDDKTAVAKPASRAGSSYNDYEGVEINPVIRERPAQVPAAANNVEEMYAQIDEKKASKCHSSAKSNDYGTVAPPPVPLKSFINEDGSTASTPNHSPSLPPRNSSPPDNSELGAVGGYHVYATPTDVPSVHGQAAGRVSGDVSVTAPLTATLPTYAISTLLSDSDRDSSEPRYSRVTARESLDNLRKRQAATNPVHSNVSFLHVSTTADAASGVLASAPDVTSPAAQPSDVYAEITTGSGESSARSSTYAQVEYMSESMSTPGQHASCQDDDDLIDPGYSRIKSRSMNHATSSAGASPLADALPSAPVYALVDKSKKVRHRQTVHGDNLISSVQHGSPTPGHRRIRMSRDSAGSGKRDSDNSVAAGKEMDNVASVDPGYQTIGSALGFKQSDDKADMGTYDPDYERVPDLDLPSSNQTDRTLSVGANLSPNHIGQQAAQRRSTGSMGKKWPWMHQEHIYQEINEARLNPPSFSLANARSAEHSAKENPSFNL